jgi:hypothetical protein
MTHRQALQGFPDTSRATLHKNNKIIFPTAYYSSSAGSWEVTVAFTVISECTV